MKRFIIILLIGLSAMTAPLSSRAQVQELEELALDIQKLSALKSILKEMYQGYQILTTGYNAVKDISEGNFSLHKLFLDKLLSVSPAVKQYIRVVDIITAQSQLIREYKVALAHFRGIQLFNSGDIAYIQSVYGNLVDRSLDDLDDLLTVLTDGKLRASDAERISAIDHIYASMEDKLEFLHAFNNKAGLLATQRQKAQSEIGYLQHLYGLQ